MSQFLTRHFRIKGARSRARMHARSQNSLKVLASNFQYSRGGRIRNFIGKYLCHPWVVHRQHCLVKTDNLCCCPIFGELYSKSFGFLMPVFDNVASKPFASMTSCCVATSATKSRGLARFSKSPGLKIVPTITCASYFLYYIIPTRKQQRKQDSVLYFLKRPLTLYNNQQGHSSFLSLKS